MNKLYQQQVSNAMPDQTRQMAEMFKTARNPQAIVNQFVQQNPKVKPVFDMLRGGANPRDLFYSMARQRGVDPESILGMLR